MRFLEAPIGITMAGTGIGAFLLPIAAMLALINRPLTVASDLFVTVCIGLAAGAELDLLALSILLFLCLGKYPEEAQREMAHG